MKTTDAVYICRILKACRDAGTAILELYNAGTECELKSDGSPVTLADRRSCAVLRRELQAIDPQIPILSEEGDDISYETRAGWRRFWLVDPLDGTKEFIKKNGQFTVNVALIEGGVPTIGVIYLPVTGLFYFALKDTGSFKLEKGEYFEEAGGFTELLSKAHRLPIKKNSESIKIIMSSSHARIETERFLNDLERAGEMVERKSAGSSLKLCLIAEGLADLYPRFGPTREWDIAAGDIIVEEAGGKVLSAERRQRLLYNKPDMLNPWFIVYSQAVLEDEERHRRIEKALLQRRVV